MARKSQRRRDGPLQDVTDCTNCLPQGSHLSLVRNLKGGVFAAIAASERLTNSNAGQQTPLHEIKNFLLLYHASALGTAIHATPLIPALHQAIPDCRIAVCASGFSLEILRHNPGVDVLIETPSPLQDLKGAVDKLRIESPFHGQPFATITPVGNERTRIALQALFSGASNRVGFTVQPGLYRVPMTFDSTKSQIANNLRIMETLGSTPTPRHFEPQIFFSEQDMEKAREVLATADVTNDQPVAVFVTQSSATQRKGWRAERFHDVAVFLREKYGAHILFVGTTRESSAIDELRQGLKFSTTNVAGKTTLPQLAALMSLCTVGLTLDTGPLHVGRAVGLPMVIIAPAWSPPIEWLPLEDDRFRILKKADVPAAALDYVIDEVSVAQVAAALEELLSKYSCQRVPRQLTASCISQLNSIQC